jgi:hypothetical protein
MNQAPNLEKFIQPTKITKAPGTFAALRKVTTTTKFAK